MLLHNYPRRVTRIQASARRGSLYTWHLLRQSCKSILMTAIGIALPVPLPTVFLSFGWFWTGCFDEVAAVILLGYRQFVELFAEEMERHLQRKVSLESGHPSCLWGVFNLFNFQQGLHIKRMSLEKKHSDGRNGEGTKGSKLNVSEAGEAQELLDPDFDLGLSGENKSKKNKRTSKRSGKAQIKSLIAKEMSKERDARQGTRALPSRLQRLYSIHHMGSEDEDLDEIPRDSDASPQSTSISRDQDLVPKYSDQPTNCCQICEVCGSKATVNKNMGTDKIEELGKQLLEKQTALQQMLDEVKESLLKKTSTDSKEVARETRAHTLKETLDALEIFNVNRDLFLKILQDPDSVLADHFQGSSSAEVVLTKSGSFPGVDLQGGKNEGRSKLKHKLLNIGSVVKREGKLLAGKGLPESNIINSSEDNCAESIPLIADKTTAVGPGLESLVGSPGGLRNSRFKNIKKKIKHVINGGKKERLRISMDGMLHKIPYGSALNDLTSPVETDMRESMSNTGYESEGPAVSSIRRTASLTESLERYSQLFESSYRREPKISRSNTLKLTIYEDGNLQDQKASRVFERIQSLPDISSYFSGREMGSEVPHDPLFWRGATRSLSDIYAADIESNIQPIRPEDCTRMDRCVENENPRHVGGPIDSAPKEQLMLDAEDDENAQRSHFDNDLDNLIAKERECVSPHVGDSKDTSIQLPQPSPNSVLNSSYQEDVSLPAKSSDTNETSDSMPTCTQLNEVETASEFIDSNLLHVQVDARDEAEFNYVRDILKKSGFSGKELFETWELIDQPVDPSVFDEVEEQPIELHSPGHEGDGSMDHLLLFDLINEVLLEIYEKSYIPIPWFLSFSSHIRPMPAGSHVLEEVWAHISWHLSLRSQLDASVEYIVARDLKKNDGWMNLELDNGYLGLELEDWILDDLLDEELLELLD